MRIEERLKDSAARHASRPAIVARRVPHSYAELELKARRLAAALRDGGVQRGTCVAVFMDDGWEELVSAFAVLMAGGVVMPVDAGTAASVFAETLRKSQPLAVITQSRLAAMVATAIAPVWSVKLIVLAGGGRADAGSTCISFEETVARIGTVPALAAGGDDGDPAVQFAGESPLSHRQLAGEADAAAIADDAVAMPRLAERAGFVCMLSALAGGRPIVAPSPFAREAIGERRSGDARQGESFGLSQLSVAGVAPVFQR